MEFEFTWYDLLVKYNLKGEILEISMEGECLKGGYIILEENQISPTHLKHIQYEINQLIYEFYKGE